MELLGLDDGLDEIILDFAYLADRYKETHPANSGDVSQVLDPEISSKLLETFDSTSSEWLSISNIEELAKIRNDGRKGYRAEGVQADEYFEIVEGLGDRCMLITRTGSDIPSIAHTIKRGQSGKLFNVLQLSNDGSQFRIVYGNKQYGSIPSIETHIHILANAISKQEGTESPAMVHSHPHYLITLARDERIAGDFGRFNAALYSAIEGINRNYPDLVGLIPYFESGSQELVLASLPVLKEHKLALWMNHGFVIRAENIRRGYTLLGYAEASARAALESLRFGAENLPDAEIKKFLEKRGLYSSYKELFAPK